MHNSDAVTLEEIKGLIEGPGQVGISLYMPTGPSADGNQVREYGIRLKNLISEAEGGISRYYRRDPALLQQLDWLRQLVDDENFWRQSASGLAIFMSLNQRKVFRLALTVPEQVYVGSSYYLLPLMPALSSASRFYVLALSRGAARLFAGDQATLMELTVEGMPASQADAMSYKESERTTQRRNGARAGGRGEQAGTHHGQGEDMRDSDLEHYLKEVDQALAGAIEGKQGLVILSGSEPALGQFRRISNYPLIAKESIELKPEVAEPAELHMRALAIAGAESEDPAVSLIHQYNWYRANQPERITSDPEALVESARQGRVEHLLISASSLTPQTGFGEQLTESTDLDLTAVLNEAAASTLMASGHCVMIDGKLIGNAPAVAILRY